MYLDFYRVIYLLIFVFRTEIHLKVFFILMETTVNDIIFVDTEVNDAA